MSTASGVERGGALWVITLIISLISPFPAVIFQCIFIAMAGKNVLKMLCFTSLIPLVVWLSAINSTKLVEGDLVNYQIFFEEAKISTFLTYIADQKREPLYALHNYFFARILEVNFSGFIFFSSVLGYLFLLGAIAKTSSIKNISPTAVIATIFVTAFFPQLFSISAHIVRQFLAGSALAIVISQFLTTGRIRVWLIVLAALIHTSAAFFLIVPIVQWIKLRLKIGSFLVQVSLFLMPFFVIKTLAVMITNLPGLGSLSYVDYAVQRASQDEFFEFSALSMSALFFIFILAVAAVALSALPLKQFDKTTKEAIRTVSVLTTSVCVLVFLLYAIQLNELAARLMFYAYVIFPFVLVIYIDSLVKSGGLIAIPVVLVTPIVFVYIYPYNGWHYVSPMDTMMDTIFSYNFWI